MCREEFPGHSPFSEKETSNVATYLSDRKFAMRAFFDIHSYSKLWLSPWGLKEDKPAEYNETMVSRNNCTRKIKNHVHANGKRQELNLCRLPFSVLCNNVKIFEFVVNRRYYSYVTVIFGSIKRLEEK